MSKPNNRLTRCIGLQKSDGSNLMVLKLCIDCIRYIHRNTGTQIEQLYAPLNSGKCMNYIRKKTDREVTK